MLNDSKPKTDLIKPKSDIGNICITVKEGEFIQAGPDVKLQVLKIGGSGVSGVRLRLSAHRNIRIFRIKEGGNV
jgi:hypothetical protein